MQQESKTAGEEQKNRVNENKKQKKKRKEEKRTDFDGGDSQTTGFEDEANTAGGDAFTESTDDAAGDQNVLHCEEEE